MTTWLKCLFVVVDLATVVLVAVVLVATSSLMHKAAFEAKKLALSQQSDESAIIPDNDDDFIFLEGVSGLNKGGSVYGLGSQSSSVNHGNSTLGSSSSTLPQQVSIAMMQDFV